MIRASVVAGALAALIAMQAPVLADDPSLAGSVYQNARVGNSANAVAGAYVYVHTASEVSGAWTGPALTDAYGRFTFPKLGAGTYLLRVFIGNQRVWQQTVNVPGKLPPIVIPAS